MDDEFTVFDGFGRDHKPVRSTGQPAATGAGLSWDEERQVWEKANRSMFGRCGGVPLSHPPPPSLHASARSPLFISPPALFTRARS